MSSRAEEYLEFGLTPAQYHGQLDRLWKALGVTKGPNGEDVFTLAIEAIKQARCKVSSIEGIPEGWELVRVGKPLVGELFINGLDEIHQAHDESHFHGCAIIRKIEKPKKYRPFANAAEFKPHRDRWWMFEVDERNRRRPPRGYDDLKFGDIEWDEMFDSATFDDGSPFGVEVTE